MADQQSDQVERSTMKEGVREGEIKRLKREVGELVMDIEILKDVQKPYLPTTQGRQTGEARVTQRLDPQDLFDASRGSLKYAESQAISLESKDGEQNA